MFYKIKRIVLFLIIGVSVGEASAQVYSKKGENPGHLDSSAALEVASTSRGFLPPRMTRKERDTIKAPAEGLQVWCTDCNSSGQLCFYLGTNEKGVSRGWASLTMYISPSIFTLTTAGNNDAVVADRPKRESATSATISGTLKTVISDPPAETGIIWREITDHDSGTPPVLGDSGTYNTTTATALTTAGAAIKVTIPTLTSATGSKSPYYFRTYAKSSLGIGYGNPVIFNCAPPDISTPVVTNIYPLSPVFWGKLTLNAGTPQGIITEYGYCSSTTNALPTTADNGVVLSDPAAITALDAQLNSENFTTDPAIADLSVNNYDVKAIALTYFRYYAVANGKTVYSNVVSFTPVPDPVTGGTAIATMTKGDEMIGEPFQAGVYGTRTFKAHFKVTKAGTYADFRNWIGGNGNTRGLEMATVPAGNFTVGDDQTLDFSVSGNPGAYLDGNTFVVSRIYYAFKTGHILPNPVTGDTAGATVTKVDKLAANTPLRIGKAGRGTIRVHFNVTSKGYTDTFTSTVYSGSTEGLSMDSKDYSDYWSVTTDKTVDFIVSGTPSASLEGNCFKVSRITELLCTGTILPNAVTGGTAVATVTVDPISKPVKAGEESTSSFTAHFNVSKAGTYADFTPVLDPTGGTTTNLTMNAIPAGNFSVGNDQRLTFTVSGLPKTSLDGNSFAVPRIKTLSTGNIQLDAPVTGNISGGNALCDATHTTTLNPVYSPKTGRVWMDRNLGASQAKTTTPADDYKAYGCLYQWGRGNDGHASITWTDNNSGTSVNPAIFGVTPPAGTTADELPVSDTPGSSFRAANSGPWDWASSSVAPKDYLWQGDGINNPCPGGYHVPTQAEFQAEIDADASLSGLHFAGTLVRSQGGGTNAVISDRGSLVWSSSTAPSSRSSYYLVIKNGKGDTTLPVPRMISDERRGDGMAVRCIKN